MPSSLSGMLIEEQNFEVKENINDPTLAFTVAGYQGNLLPKMEESPSKVHHRHHEVDHTHKSPLPTHHLNQQSSQTLPSHNSNTKKIETEATMKVSTAKKPKKISHDLWDKITSVRNVNATSA